MKEMANTILKRINDLATPVKIMHVCGSHEHTIMEHGIRSLLPPEVEIVAGPGCPVCVVPSREIDECLQFDMLYGLLVLLKMHLCYL
jgi:hydrogenase expression/formation protein HypD